MIERQKKNPLATTYERELSAVDSYNPYKGDPKYLATLHEYMDRIDSTYKHDNPAIGEERERHADISFLQDLHFKALDGDDFWKWMYYDADRYYMHIDKTAALINHTAYDPFPATILTGALRGKNQFELVEKILSSAIPHEQRNYEAKTAYTQSHPEEAKKAKFVTAYEKLQTSYARMLSDLGFAQLRLSKYEESLESLNHALDINGEDAYSAQLKVRVLIALKKIEEASHVADELLAAHPENEHVYITKALVLHFEGKFRESLPLLNQAIALSEKDPFAHQLKASALLRLNKPKDALTEMDTALALRERSVSRLVRAEILSKLGRYNEVIADIDLYLQGNSKVDRERASFIKADALVNTGESARVAQAQEILGTLDQKRGSVMWLEAKCAAILGKRLEAKRLLVRLLADSYAQGHIWPQYAEAYLSLINAPGYEMDSSEQVILTHLRDYFGESHFAHIMARKDGYDWNTPVVESPDEIAYRAAVYNPVLDGMYTSAVNKSAKNDTGVPVFIKTPAPSQAPVVETKRRRIIRP